MRRTAGTVLVLDSHILLCKPTNNFGGYVWTFPKGGIDKYETPEQAALRETMEEAGYRAQLLARLPGEYKSKKSVGTYYIATPIGKQKKFDRAETEATGWFTPHKALIAISRSPNKPGKERDLLVLYMARRLLGI